jgi:EmrB/QacA subfamily drug resistance transporter
MVAAGGGAVGLMLGGILTQYVNWRWNFFINVPVGALVMLAAFKYIPASLPQKRERVDYIGAITITGSLMSLVYGLAKAPTAGWGSATTVVSLIAAAVLMVTFIVNEMRVKHPLIKLSIFRRRNVTGGTIIQLLMPAAMFGMFFYISIYLQQILGYSPTKTGAANLPFTLTIMVIAGVLSKHATKVNPKMVLSIAPLVVAAGLLFFARIPVHASYVTDVLPGILLMASGMAAVFVTATMATTNGVSHQESGLVSGLLNTGQQVGGAIGLAVLTVVSTAATKHEIAQGAVSGLPHALVTGFHSGFLVAAGFAVVASGIALTVFKVHKPSAEEVAQETENEAEALAAIPGV